MGSHELVALQSYNNPSGLSEVVIGCAGNIEGHENKWQDPIPGYCAVHNGDTYGYGVLNVFNDTTLSWTFHSATNSSIEDQFVLTKDNAAGPAIISKPKLRGAM